jgi:hypothetical protein
MGFGDNEPPSVRADPFPATLTSGNHFKLLILTFVPWDVIKLDWSREDGPGGRLEFHSGRESTDFIFGPVKSGARYSFVATGCAKAIDGSTNFCSPPSDPISIVAATNTNKLRQFLQISGITTRGGISLRTVIASANSVVSLKSLMGLNN